MEEKNEILELIELMRAGKMAEFKARALEVPPPL